MKVKDILMEDFVNYKLPSMFISTSKCSFKCDKECGKPVCQNSSLAAMPDIEIADNRIVEKYLGNPITKAVVIGGLEPFDDYAELINFITTFRRSTDDPVVIYTGYTEQEVAAEVEELRHFGNIVVKFGRFRPDEEPHFDEVLGVKLASSNQHAVELKEDN